MNLNFRKLIQSSAAFSIMGTLPTLSRIVLLPIFLVFVTPYNFGIIGLNATIASALPIFLSLGYNSTFSRYFFDYKKNHKLIGAYLSTVLIMTMGISLFFLIITIPFGQKIHNHVFKHPEFTYFPYGISALITATTSALNTIQLLYYLNMQKTKSYLWLSGSVFVVSTIAEALAILVFRFEAAGIIWCKLIGVMAVTIVSLIFLFKEIGGLKFDFRFLSNSFKYSLSIIPYVVFGFIYSSYDRVMIENYLNFTSLAVFNVSMAIVMFVEIGIASIQGAMYPPIYEMFKVNHKSHEESINKIFRLMGLVVMVIIGGLCAATPLVIHFLKPVYSIAVYLVPVLLISYLFRYLYIVYSVPLFYFKNQVRKLPWLNFVAGCVTVGVNILLLPSFGLLGAAITAVIVRMAVYFMTWYFAINSSDFVFNLGYFWWIFGIVIFLLCGIFSCYYLFNITATLFKCISFLPLIFVIVFYVIRLKLYTMESISKIFKPSAFLMDI